MNNYKERFLALLSEREKLIEEQNSYSRKIREIGETIDNNKDKIDLVFAEMIMIYISNYLNREEILYVLNLKGIITLCK